MIGPYAANDGCNPLVIHRDGEWQAWCKTCGWESPATGQYSLAIHWRNQHQEEARP